MNRSAATIFFLLMTPTVFCGCRAGHGKYQGTSLLGEPLYALSWSPQRVPLDRNLEHARAELNLVSDDPQQMVWLGRRLGYLWRMNEAVRVYSQALKISPDHAALYRHRGHRYLSLREFDLAVADLSRAAELIRNRPDTIEQNGIPNAENISLTTLGFNVWYHLGLAHYFNGDFDAALTAFRQCKQHAQGHDDNLVAVTDWMYMSQRRLGRLHEAQALLRPISPGMEVIENQAYHQRLLMYKGLLQPQALLDAEQAGALDLATMGYGVGNWYLYNGQHDRATEIFEQIVAGEYWPAFGFIAAEVELARMEQ